MKKNRMNVVYILSSFPCIICSGATQYDMLEKIEAACILVEMASPRSYLHHRISDPFFSDNDYSFPVPAEPSSKRKKRQRMQSRAVICQTCNRRFANDKNVQRHIQSVHTKIKHQCSFCEKRFSYKYTLDRHIKSMHENMTYTCNLCKKRYRQKEGLTRHIRVEHERITFQCYCGKSFADVSSMKKHVGKKHPDRDVSIKKRQRRNG